MIDNIRRHAAELVYAFEAKHTHILRLRDALRAEGSAPVEMSVWPEQVDDAPPCVWPPSPEMPDDEPEAHAADESVAHQWTHPPSLAIASPAAKTRAPVESIDADLAASVLGQVTAYPQTAGKLAAAFPAHTVAEVGKALARLVASGAIVRTGAKRGTRYALPVGAEPTAPNDDGMCNGQRFDAEQEDE